MLWLTYCSFYSQEIFVSLSKQSRLCKNGRGLNKRWAWSKFFARDYVYGPLNIQLVPTPMLAISHLASFEFISRSLGLNWTWA